MALPGTGQLYNEPSYSAGFMAPRDKPKLPLESWSRGGIGLNNAIEGLDLYDWKFTMNGTTGDMSVGIPDVLADTVFYTVPLVTSTTPIVDFSASFDNNMQPVFSWGDYTGTYYFRWYDPIAVAFVTIQLPEESYAVRVVMDDSREGQNNFRDTIVGYIRGDRIYYRQLRDRFAIEYDLSALPDTKATWWLYQLGMNEKWRLQFRLKAVQGHPVPVTEYVVPMQVAQSTGPCLIRVHGHKFHTTSVVRVDGVVVPTTYESREVLVATIPASVIAVAGLKSITVHTRWPGGGTSDDLDFIVINAATFYRLTENGNRRILENGDRRILE